MFTISDLISLQTIVYKEVVRVKRIWVQSIFPPIITTSLYFIIFGTLIGRRLGQMHGFDYIDFIVPGLVIMPVISNAFINVASSFYGAKFGHYIEELLVSPTPNIYILIGYMFGGIVRGLIIGAVVLGVSMLFTQIHLYSPLLMFITLFLTATLFSIAGLINAMYAYTFDDVNYLPTFFLGPLTYLGGVFYSISMLPPIWQTISIFNPILYIVNAFRYSTLGVSDVDLVFSYGIIIGTTAILFVAALYLLNRGYGLRS